MNRLKQLRLSSGLKQADVAKQFNCSRTAISNYETGLRGIDSETLCKICDFFGCTTDYLLGRSSLPSTDLSAEEAALLLAFRRADDRARDMVKLALAPFSEEDSAEKAI